MENVIIHLTELDQKLAEWIRHPQPRHVVAGFDGFVDSIRKAVRRKDETGTHYYDKIGDFADRIAGAAGKSSQIEMQVMQTKMGGNAPILSNALGALGIRSTCIGSMGLPDRHAVFSSISNQCQTVSVASPGESDAVEFSDGKLIFSDLGNLEMYDWNHVRKTVGLDKLKTIFNGSDFIALVDWANLHHATDLWEGLLNDVIKPSGRRNFMFLFDLCDPSKKPAQALDDILDIISSYSFYGSVTLGINENEAITSWHELTGSSGDNSLHNVGKFIHCATTIDCLLIHPLDRSMMFHKNEFFEIPGRFVKNPKLQTGGGDNLNAGYILGRLAGFTLQESMVLGMAASGFYVQEGRSASVADLQKYIRQWKHELQEAARMETV